MIQSTTSVLISAALLLISIPVDARVVSATFYASNLQGNVMKNGKRFDHNSYTAAHPSYPMRTRLKLTNVKTKQSTVVTVTDRCACSLDLSRAAYKAVGGKIYNGRVRVQITKL